MFRWIFNVKIRTILVSVASLVIVVLVIGTSMNSMSLTEVEENSNKQMEEVLPNTFDFLNLQLNVIQIQQWLTDVSATRGYEGFDDGFDEAQGYFEKANVDVDRLIRMHEALDETQMVSDLQSYKKDLADYYEVGKKNGSGLCERRAGRG